MTIDKGGFSIGQKLDQIYGNRKNRGLPELLQGRKNVGIFRVNKHEGIFGVIKNDGIPQGK